jgi:hypothetical protein
LVRSFPRKRESRTRCAKLSPRFRGDERKNCAGFGDKSFALLFGRPARWQTRHELPFPLTGRRALRAQAQARARGAPAGDRDHRFSWCRQDHASQPLPDYAGRTRDRGRGQRIRRDRHRRRAGAIERGRNGPAWKWMHVLLHQHRFAANIAATRGGPRARRGAGLPPHRNRNQRTGRSQARSSRRSQPTARSAASFMSRR